MMENILETVQLSRGNHASLDKGACAMELVSYLADEPWSDHPKCASPVIAEFVRSWQDSVDDETRQRFKPYIPRIVGTAAAAAVELRRAWLAQDWIVREFTPAWLELVEAPREDAAQLRALPEIQTVEQLKAALPLLREAREKAQVAWDAAGAAAGAAAWDAARAAAWDAARDAAWAAAGAAAGAAAWDAARAAAWDAAWAAAWAAAWDAAWAAAWDAAWAAAGAAVKEKLQPTVAALQESAFRLLDRMIECK